MVNQKRILTEKKLEINCVYIVKSLEKTDICRIVIDFIPLMCYNSVTLRAESDFPALSNNRRKMI